MLRNPVVPLAGLVFAAALACMPQPADATGGIHMATNGGGACKPAYGASDKFTFTELYALNIGTTDQYLVCHFADLTIGPNYSAQPIYQLDVYLQAGATGGTAVCTVKMGYWSGSPQVASLVTRPLTLTANQRSWITFVGSELPRYISQETLSMNCRLPGGFKLGLIDRSELEPPSGYGWTP